MSGHGLVCGVGVNDADYDVMMYVDGKRVKCPYYKTWTSMITRCYSDNYHNIRSTYKDCTVCDEWLVFSNFKKWMEQQVWNGKSLDKDIIVEGNCVYSPSTCAFVSYRANAFVRKGKQHSNLPIGVSMQGSKYKAQCMSGGYLGLFSNPELAHNAWLRKKRELAIELARSESDKRVSSALLKRYYGNIPNADFDFYMETADMAGMMFKEWFDEKDEI